MAAYESTDRQTYSRGSTVYVAALGTHRRVQSARFDRRGKCTSWTDTLGTTHTPGGR